MESRRSGCPVSISLEMLGDRWSLLIVRDMMVRGYRTFKDFKDSGEGIATNILSDRLRRLEADGLVVAERDEDDQRRITYRLTEKGIDLAPVVLELLIWGAKHEETGAPNRIIAEFERNREKVLKEVRRRWEENDPTPFLPRFGPTDSTVHGHSSKRRADGTLRSKQSESGGEARVASTKAATKRSKRRRG